MTKDQLSAGQIKSHAKALGFDAVGITRPADIADYLAAAGGHLDRFLAEGREGQMTWLRARAAERRHPQALWPDVRSVIAVGLNYGPAEDPMGLLDRPDKATISVYARGKDYHDLVKKRLKRLARWMSETTGDPVKVFVDTAPVMEKPLAEAAGIGWQGKHTNLVNRDLGSWLFLGMLFTTLDLDPDRPHQDACGSCRQCLDICPTDAFPAPYQLDARRCISYLTIEHDGPIPREFRRPMGNRIYGCDDCLAICPWNKFAERASEAQFFARAELSAPDLGDLAQLDDAGFRRVFSGSPIKRSGRNRFVRNVMIAIGNSARPALLGVVEARLSDPSAQVRGAAVWALGELAPDRAAAQKAAYLAAEDDADVRAEWAWIGGG